MSLKDNMLKRRERMKSTVSTYFEHGVMDLTKPANLHTFIVQIAKDIFSTESTQIVERIDAVEQNLKDHIDFVPKRGIQGEAGPRGERGATGDSGERGRDGKDGRNGSDGINGKDGENAAVPEDILKALEEKIEAIKPVIVTGGKRGGAGDVIQAGTNITITRSGGKKVISAVVPTSAVSVTDETTYGITPAVGTSALHARQDHTHGTMATPTKSTVGLSNVENTSDLNKVVSTATQTALDLKEATANKDASGGYAGLNLFKINFKNAANTFINFLTNATTAARTYTFPDKDITVAGIVDITGTNSGVNTGDNSVNTLYSGLVSNATHTGDAEGATALTVKKINGVALSGLATGILKNTTTTGVPSIATGADLPAMSATVGGAVPTPPNNTTTFLRGDGTFAAPTGGAGDMVLATVQTNSALKTFLDATLGLRNVANTFTGLFTNTITAARTWTLKDADGTLAFTSDITGTNSGTNTGDNSVNTLYSGLVTNQTHTGDATGANALTVVKIQGKDFPALAVGDDQKYPKYNHGTNAFIMTAVTAAASDQNPNLLVQAADYSLLTTRGMVIPYYYEIGDTFTLDIAIDAVMDII